MSKLFLYFFEMRRYIVYKYMRWLLKRKYNNRFLQAEQAIEDISSKLRNLNEVDRALELTNHLRISFEYEQDKVDFVYDPAIFWILRKGDCDDYALYCCEIFKQLGITSYFVSIRNRKEGHAICVYLRSNGSLSIISNWSISNPFDSLIEYETIEQVASTVYNNWNQLIIRDDFFKLQFLEIK